MARKWIWLTLVLVVGGIAGFFVFKGGSGQAKSDANPIEAVEKADEAEGELQEQREALKLAIIGADGQLREARHTASGWIVGVEMKAKTLHLSNMLQDALTLLEEVDRTTVPIERVTIDFRSNELKDVYGHQLQDVAVAKIRLDGQTFKRINWHGFETDNFARLAEVFWIHEGVLQQGGQQGGGGGQGGQSGGEGGGGGDGGGGGSGGGGGGGS